MMRDKGCDVVVVVQCAILSSGNIVGYLGILRVLCLCLLRVVRMVELLHNGTSSPLSALLSGEEPTLLFTTLSLLLLILGGKFTSNIILPLRRYFGRRPPLLTLPPSRCSRTRRDTIAFSSIPSLIGPSFRQDYGPRSARSSRSGSRSSWSPGRGARPLLIDAVAAPGSATTHHRPSSVRESPLPSSTHVARCV